MAPKHPAEHNEKICDLLKKFHHDNAVYEKVASILLDEMEKGLDKKTNASAVIKMFPTYVRSLPDGTETGQFLALDLGGTNFRVLLVTLKGSEVTMENKIFPIAEEIMLGAGTKLFDHIASCIKNFLVENKINTDKTLPLGFTFSFPLKQEGLNKGRLVTWTKGFKSSGVEGNDVVGLLHDAVKRRGDLNIECVAIINDTVGCQMSCAFEDHNCEIGVILGTGTNACYMERLERVGTWDSDHNEPKQVIINTEWGAFGDNQVIDFIRTHADREVDRISLNPGKQLYEKMISGMYMGEIARQAIVEAAKDGLVFNGSISEEMGTHMRFYTKYISEIEKDAELSAFPNTRQVLDEMGYEEPSMEDLQNVHYICHIIGKRAAYLASAGIACLLNRINKPSVTVAVDGSLYRFHPKFHDFMMEKITDLLKPELKSQGGSQPFKLVLSQDGSGRGAALVAAVAHRLMVNNN